MITITRDTNQRNLMDAAESHIAKTFLLAFSIFAGSVPVTAREVPSNTPEARQALEAYGRCVARRSPKESARVLAMDFTTTDFRTGLRMLATSMAKDCTGESFGMGALSGGNLLFAGAIAEGLLNSGAGPIDTRLTQAASTQVPVFAPTDAIAQCLARSHPDQVGALFSTAPGTEAETAAASPLTAAVPTCAKSGAAKFDISVPALRAMIATAAFRLTNMSGNGREAAK